MSTEQDELSRSHQPATQTGEPLPRPEKEESKEKRFAEEVENAFGQAETGVTNEEAHDHHHKTLGLRIFDHVLFNLANIGVFGLSVFATYKTNFPGNKGNVLSNRTDQFTAYLGRKGIKEETAKDFNMVVWSFVDGLIAIPFISALKRARPAIGRTLDKLFGTTPKDTSVYDEQPKEGWKTVFLGRLAAFCTVIPTFFLMKRKGKTPDGNPDPNALSMNDRLFKKPAKRILDNDTLGIPGRLSKRFGPKQAENLITTGIFETFYTTLCTIVLFFVSPILGRRDKERMEKKSEKESTDASRDIAPWSSDSAPEKHTDTHAHSMTSEHDSTKRLATARPRIHEPAATYTEMRTAEKNNAVPGHLSPAS